MNQDEFDETDQDLALGVRDGIRMGGVLILIALLFAIFFALAGCGTVKPPAPPPVVDPTGATCETACARIAALGCADNATRCVPACENVQASGVFAYDVGCLARAVDCAAVSACFP